MGKKKRKRDRDDIRDYMLSCECCPLHKEGKSHVDMIIDGVMNRLGYPSATNKHICTARKCIVNPKKPREQCPWRDEYWKKHGIHPVGLIDGIENPASSILCRSPS